MFKGKRLAGFLAVIAAAVVVAAFSGSLRAEGDRIASVAQAPEKSNQAEMSNEIWVAVSRDRNSVWAISKETGAWEKITLQNPGKQPIDIESSRNVACVSFGNDVYAFSALTGAWEKITLENPGEQTVSFECGSDVADLSFGNDVHAFSAVTGTWDTLHLDAPAEPSIGNGWVYLEVGTELHVFTAKTGKWESVDLAE